MKTYLYIPSGAPGVSSVTEQWIREQMIRWPLYAPHGEQVLALDIGQHLLLDSGARYERIADNSEPVRAVFCGGRGRRNKSYCTHISYGRQCGVSSDYLCDFQIGEKDGKRRSCDRPRCGSHSVRMGPDIDYCLDHARADEANR